jgi:intein-encoded DNA endonuclease-like protein
MKIIAKVDSSRVLCEVTMEELAFLNGYRSSYESGFNKEQMSTVGTECNLKKMVATSQFVRSIRKDTLQKTKDNLEEIISKLDETMETVAGLELFNILNEEKQIGDN